MVLRRRHPDPRVQNFVGSWLEDSSPPGELVSGPRWRLRPNKFGQDLPGLEIPLIECSPPPFEKQNIKHEVGEQTIMEINLLDWSNSVGRPSPLATTLGWVDVTRNGVVKIADVVNGVPVTGNGLPMTDDFDLAVYIKGDKKPVAVYDARLVLEWDDQTPVLIDVPDVVALAEAAAVTAIEAYDLVASVAYDYSDVVAAGLVISQDPVACVTVDSTVSILVSLGPAQGLIDVPDVTSLSQAAAETAITNAGLTVDDVTTASSNVVPAGDVISQDPAACTECAAAGDPVDLVVSTGPAVLSDISITALTVPTSVRRSGVIRPVSVTIRNAPSAAGPGSGTVSLSGSDGSLFTTNFVNLAPGSSLPLQWDWLTPTSQVVTWTATVTVGGVVVDTETVQTVVQ